MKKMLAVSVFMLATLAWASAQQPGGMPRGGSGQATSPNSQVPGATQSQPSAPITEGCLGGSAPNFTITDKTGTTYKLNIPPSADTSKLTPHIGESVQVAGNVNNAGQGGNSSIDVQGIGRGTGTCPAGGSSGAQSPPKQ